MHKMVSANYHNLNGESIEVSVGSTYILKDLDYPVFVVYMTAIPGGN